MSELKQNIKDSFASKIGALFMKGTFKKMKETFNISNYGGATFLGVKKLIVKGHGSSDAVAFEKCILQVRTLANFDLCKKIEEQVKNIGDGLDEQQ